jgi:hypothetical protein
MVVNLYFATLCWLLAAMHCSSMVPIYSNTIMHILSSKTDWYEEVFTLLVEYYTTLVHTALAISCHDGALADCPWMERAKTEFSF